MLCDNQISVTIINNYNHCFIQGKFLLTHSSRVLSIIADKSRSTWYQSTFCLTAVVQRKRRRASQAEGFNCSLQGHTPLPRRTPSRAILLSFHKFHKFCHFGDQFFNVQRNRHLRYATCIYFCKTCPVRCISLCGYLTVILNSMHR